MFTLSNKGQGLVEFVFILFVLAILVCVAANMAGHPVVNTNGIENLFNALWHGASQLATK